MSNTTSQKSLWMTVGAAGATIVAILGIALGPSIATCTQSEIGFAGCLSNKLADAGFGTGSTLDPGAPEGGTTQQSVANVDAAADVASESADAATATAVAEPEALNPTLPTIGLVRAEPDGSLVMAGSAEPGAEVSIFANGELLGTTVAEASGDWVFVPDAQLDIGGVELTVGVPASNLTAEQSVVVVIQDDRSSEPLVVASVPGQASDVLQGLTKPVETLVAVADTAPTPTDVMPADSVAQPQETADAKSEEPIVTATDEPESVEVAAIAVADAIETAAKPLVNEIVQSAENAETAVTAAVEGASEVAGTAADEAAKAVTAVTETALKQTADAVSAINSAGALVQPAAAPVFEAAAPIAEAAALTMASIDAIEVDGERNYFAGGGSDGAVVRLYVDETFVAETTVNGDRWLVETDTNFLTKEKQRIRVDMLRDGTAAVAARAQVDFEVQLPEPIVAEIQPQPVVETEVAVVETAAAQSAAIEAPSEHTEPADQTVEMNRSVEPAETAINAAATDSNAAILATAPQIDVAEDVDLAAATDEEAVPTLTAVQVGEPGEKRFASGSAIIRRGDNLWSIARRVYGSGFRYTTIYQANRQQIGNPDLIFPGQVFELPATD